MKFLAAHALKKNCGRVDETGETINPDSLEFYWALGIAPAEEKIYFRLSGEAPQQFAET